MKTIFSLVAGLALFAGQISIARADNDRNVVVKIGEDVEIKAGETVRQVVVIGGSIKIEGDVEKDVVVVGGDAQVDGSVGHDLVVVLGGSHLGPQAEVQHDMVTVGGTAEMEKGATVHGHTQQVVLPRLLRFAWLRDWLHYCVFELKPLSFHVGWVWAVAGIAFLLYLVVSALFPHPVAMCAKQLTERPGLSFAAALVVKLLLPLGFFLLAVTVIGAFVIPIIVVAEIVAVIVGKTALLEFLGGKILRLFGKGDNFKAPVMLVVGCLIVTICYLVPILGFLTFFLVSIWGFGAAVMALAIATHRPPAPVVAASTTSGYPPLGTQPFTMPPEPSPVPPMTSPIAPPVTSIIAHALSMPRAGFWARMGAGFLDLMLVCVVAHWTGPFVLVVLVAYFAAMWAWKGTTIGGIVLNLQVVRHSGQPMDFLTSFVRSLAACFSVVVLFLGFFWIAWDPDKQAWHDKIAGTVVVRLPKAVSLVCV